MLRLLIEKEIREQIGSPKFALSFGICATLILLSFFIGARNYVVVTEQYDAAVSENLRQISSMTDWFGVQHTIYNPPQPLSALVSGISNDLGRSIRMSQTGELRPTNSRFNEDPLLAVFRFLDLEFVFGIVLSLFAVLFAYDAVNGEKERGTLRLALSNSVPRSTYILGKLLGTFLSLFIPLLIPFALGIVLLPVFGVNLTGDELVRLLAVLGIGFVFFTAFLTLSVWVSALTRRSSYSFILLLVLWICSVLILPRTAVLTSARFVKVPSVDEVEKQKREYAAQLSTEDREKMNNFKPPADIPPQEMMQEFGKFMGQMAAEREKKIEEFNSRLNEDRVNRSRAQERLAMSLARVSPTTSMALAMTHVAGTSLGLKDRFLAQATDYQTKYREFLSTKGRGSTIPLGSGTTVRVLTSGSGVQTGGAQESKPLDVNEMPAFEYNDVVLADVLPGALIDMAILLGFTTLFFCGAFVAFLRFDVR